ncbi:hypothetical protein B0E53_02053 [Micromonospora sp. MH33]|nr:hypothetical protein B0E53_02053 [Micromonospora sp. MH33]
MEPRFGEAIIGREHPAALLRAEVDRVTASHGGLVLVAGEPGIGKTTLVSAAADEARRRGALVLGAACWDADQEVPAASSRSRRFHHPGRASACRRSRWCSQC